jgi:hypothetical protein
MSASKDIVVHRIRFRAATPKDQRGGLLGWLSFGVRGFEIDAVQLRRSRAGRIELFWPERKSSDGRRHMIVCASDADECAAIERDLMEWLRGSGVVP